MKRIAILGGTFNPIHNAHLKMAGFVYATGKYDEILFLPTGNPPHKEEGAQIASKKHRMNMCSLAIKDTPYFSVSDMEMRRKGASFTVDTLIQLKEESPQNEYTLIIGADSLLNIKTWHNSKKLLQIGRFLVINRLGYENQVESYMNYFIGKYKTPIKLLDMPIVPISSSKIRQAIAEKKSISEWVPASVEEYIKKNNLYKGSTVKDIDMHMLELKLKNNLSDKRFIHSVSVMKTAKKLADNHNCNVDQAAIAGLLHDCAKSLSNDKKLEMAIQYSYELSPAENENPDLLHAKLGAVVAKEKYGIIDPEILNAIECHTTGKPNMTTLDKIIYIADYIEPKRPPLPNIDNLRKTAMHSLDEALLEILEQTLDYLKAHNRTIDSRSMETYLYYKDSVNVKI